MAQTVYPTLRYRDPEGAIDWLQRALGFVVEESYRDEAGDITHAALSFRGNRIMIGPPRPSDLPASGPAWTYLVADDVDGLHGQATAHGADVVLAIQNMDYGSREFTIRDGDGHLWSVGTYQPDAE